MIGDLNSFVQFMAAIYLTLTIDSLLFKRYWSPAYYEMVTTKFKSTQHLEQKLQDSIKNMEDVITVTARKRGAILLIACLTTLIFAAFELEWPGTEAKFEAVSAYVNQYVCFDLYLYLTMIAFVVFMCWKVNFLVVLVVVALLPLVFLLNFSPTLLSYIQCLHFISDSRILLIIVLLLPIVYQITVNWLYSDIFRKYLVRSLNSVYKDYRSAKEAFAKEDANLLPDSYKDIAAEFSVRHINADEQVTLLYQYLYKQLGEACISPRLRSLFGQIFKEEEDVHAEEKDDFPVTNEDQPVSLNMPEQKPNTGKPKPTTSQLKRAENGSRTTRKASSKTTDRKKK